MPRFVVLLRGVNVGKSNRVPMADFRDLLRRLGYKEVQTLLNSGNAVFNSAGRSAACHARAVSLALQERLNVEVPVVVKSASEFAASVAECPFVPPVTEHSQFLVAFAQEAAALTDLSVLQAKVEPPEQFSIGTRAAYLHCAGGILESRAAGALLGTTGRGVTTRNWATVMKLQALVNASAT